MRLFQIHMVIYAASGRTIYEPWILLALNRSATVIDTIYMCIHERPSYASAMERQAVNVV